MSKTRGVRSRRRARSTWRAVRRLPALYVAAFGWAVATVAGEVIPVGLIAHVVLLIGVVIALYAVTAAFVVFVVCGRFGIVRTPRWRSSAATIAVGSSFAWILASAWDEGRMTLNLVAIAAAEVAGVALYLGRRSALAAARRRLHVKAGRPTRSPALSLQCDERVRDATPTRPPPNDVDLPAAHRGREKARQECLSTPATTT